MEYVNLKNGYLLSGFDNFESAFSATEMLSGKGLEVAYLNETTYVREMEIREYSGISRDPYGMQYQRCHATWPILQRQWQWTV